MESLTDSAIEQIKRMIVEGRLRPGDRLPREQDLADLLGLSRGTLREAVRALAAMKVVDVRRGDGTYVTSLAPELMLEALEFVVDLHRDDSVLHFLQVRSFVEPECTARAALQADGRLLSELAQLLDEADGLARTDPVDHQRLMENDHRFHAAVNSGGGNPVAAAILAATAGVTTRARISRSVDVRAELTTVEDHRAIYEAIRARDPARARLRAAMHIARTEDWVRDQLGASKDATVAGATSRHCGSGLRTPRTPRSVSRVGLTGGIAAGKSIVSARLRALGAVVIDADELARAVVKPGTPGLAAIVETFGFGVLDADGEVEFRDENARRRLQSLVYPLIDHAAQELEDAAVAANPTVVLVHEIPWYVETGQAGPGSRFDVIVVVDVPVETQLARLVTERGMTLEQAQARVSAQPSRADRRAVADVVLDNTGTIPELVDQIDRLWFTQWEPFDSRT